MRTLLKFSRHSRGRSSLSDFQPAYFETMFVGVILADANLRNVDPGFRSQISRSAANANPDNYVISEV